LKDSPQASAALSRRCLQSIIRNELKIVRENLFDEINEAVKMGHFPSRLLEDLHAIRQLGNLAAHPMSNTVTGEIVPVEFQEAEYTLAVLEDVFEHLFIAPKRQQQRRDVIAEKLRETKKSR